MRRVWPLIGMLWLCGPSNDLFAAPAKDSSPAVEAPKSGVLSVEGDPLLAARLDRDLGRALSRQKLPPIFGPAELQLAIARAEGVRQALEEAHRLLSEAVSASTHMQRGEAVAKARAAIARLRAVGAKHHARAQLGRAYGELGLALLLKPKDEAGAREAFQAAVRADGRFRADADRTPPVVAALVQQARSRRTVTMPTLAEFRALATQAGVKNLVWLKADSDGAMELVIFAMDKGIVGHHKRRLPSSKLAEATADWVAERMRAGHLAPPLAKKLSQRWYGKWWVWAAGAVLVGAGIATGVALSSNGAPPSGYTFVFEQK